MFDNKRNADLVEARLDELAASVVTRKLHDFGYPVNQKAA